MMKRLVVCLRWRPSDGEANGEAFVHAAGSVIERMASLGGRLVLWHSDALGVDFALEALQDAIDFIVDRPVQAFGVGFAYGSLSEMLDGGPMLAACSGPTVERAVALARMARAGEVLLEPALVRASGGELLVAGARVATIGGERIRGLRLDLGHPQRSLECESVARLVTPPWSGPVEARLEVCPGQLSLVMAPPGGGGSRLLEEVRAVHDSRSLVVRRFKSGQPQGALLHAFISARLQLGRDPELSTDSRGTLEKLLAGQGCATTAAAALVSEWARRHSERKVVYLHDAGEVDFDSLEAVALAVEQGSIATAANLDSGVPLPLPLGRLPQCSTLTLKELTREHAVRLLRSMTRNQLAADAAQRLALRGMPYALGVGQSLVEALDSANYLWTEAGVVPRVPRDDTPEPQTAEYLLRRRLHFVELNDRLILDTLAVLGGTAEQADIVQLLTLAGRDLSNIEASLDYLSRMGWLSLGPGSLVALATRTQRAGIISSLSDRRFRTLHQAAATLTVESGKPLALASAALHAGLAGNEGKATLIAKRAANVARAAGLEATAVALQRFAETGKLAELEARALAGGSADRRIRAGENPQDDQFLDSSLAPETAASANLRAPTLPAEAPPSSEVSQQSSEPIVSVVTASSQRDAEAPSGEPLASEQPQQQVSAESASAASDAQTTSEQVTESDLEAMSADDMDLELVSEDPEGNVQRPLVEMSTAARQNGGSPVAPTLRVQALPSDSASLMPERASQALHRGDPVTLDELARQLRREAHTLLADRLDAMASLVRGNVGEALRRLRSAKMASKELSLSEQCRAALALSVAVAAAGRSSDALLEVLEGLALARRAGDLRGERACSKFLAQLATRAGHHQIAEAWQALSASPSDAAAR